MQGASKAEPQRVYIPRRLFRNYKELLCLSFGYLLLALFV